MCPAGPGQTSTSPWGVCIPYSSTNLPQPPTTPAPCPSCFSTPRCSCLALLTSSCVSLHYSSAALLYSAPQVWWSLWTAKGALELLLLLVFLLFMSIVALTLLLIVSNIRVTFFHVNTGELLLFEVCSSAKLLTPPHPSPCHPYPYPLPNTPPQPTPHTPESSCGGACICGISPRELEVEVVFFHSSVGVDIFGWLVPLTKPL